MLRLAGKNIPCATVFNGILDLNNPDIFETDTTDKPRGVDLGYETDWRRFNKLDRTERPGVSEREFYGLFVKCDACGLVMTHLVFPDHYCRPLGEDGTELTDVDEDEV
jgi:hypothetical protein